MKKVYLLFMFISLALGLSAQELIKTQEWTEDDFENPDEYWNLGFPVFINDTIKSSFPARMNLSHGDTTKMRVEKEVITLKMEKVAIEWVKQFVPLEILLLVDEFNKKERFAHCFFITCDFNKNGIVNKIQFMISDELYRKLTDKQIKQLYRDMQNTNLQSLSKYFDFTEEDIYTYLEFNICELMQKELIKVDNN